MAKKRKQLLTSEDAVIGVKQHKSPCSDCPWRRDSLPGWLGAMSPEEWIRAAHGISEVECHTILKQQCAGIAIYRSNVCKLPDPPSIKLPANRDKVFANPAEFLEHHGSELTSETFVPKWS